MKRTASLGTVSSGTLRPEDLVPAFAAELRRLRGALPKQLARDVRSYVSDAPAPDGMDADEFGAELVQELSDALEAYAPPLAYFGTHPGDGADFGFWVDPGSLEDFDGLRVSDLSEVPASYRGEVLHVNDHGNASLYVQTSRTRLLEVWSIV